MESKSELYRKLKEGKLNQSPDNSVLDLISMVSDAGHTVLMNPMNEEALRRIVFADDPAIVVVPAQPDEAIKYDEGKPRYDLIPPEALDGLARLYAMGAQKYDDRNWEKGMAWGRIFRAMIGHAWAWFRGEDYCPKDGQHHLLSVIWNAMALYTYQMRKTGTDDRPGGCIDPATYEAVWRRIQIKE